MVTHATRWRLTDRSGRLGTETAFEVLQRAQALEAQGKHIIHLEIGEPDFATPPHVVAAGVAALREGHTHYTPSAGMTVLRQTIAHHIATSRAIPVDINEVVVTPGAKPILFFTLLALVQDGDEVVYPDPGFPIYESMIRYCGGIPVPVALREERGFAFDLNDVRSHMSARTRLIIINSPHNPTGGVLGPEILAGIAALSHEYDVPVLSDEIYSRLLYDGNPFASIASLPGMKERTIILDGFSKTYAMTGWRLGYGVMPIDLAGHVTRLMTNSNSCTAGFTQMAGVAALTGPDNHVLTMIDEFHRRRDVIVAGLNAIPGLTCLRPDGAFYAFPNITATGQSSRSLADYLLTEAGVAVLAGTSFGQAGEGYIRLSYANSIPNIEEALQRIAHALPRL